MLPSYPFTYSPMESSKILIVGGGVAGLSAGIYARKNGYQSTIIEMHDKAGGQLTNWTRDGYRFDYCLHWLVGTDHGTFNNIWKETGALKDRTEVIDHEVFIRYEDEEHGEFFIYNNLDQWEEYLLNQAPEDEKAIKKLCNMMRKGDKMEQFEDPPSLRNPLDYVRSLYKMGSFFRVLIKYGKKTCDELFTDVGFTNQKVLYFLNKLFEGKDFSALGFIMMMGWAHAKNSGYLKGGSLQMANRMAHTFKGLGGEFLFNSKVEKILVEKDKAIGVQLSDGNQLYADQVIAACDLHTVIFDMLDGKYISDEFRMAFENWDLFTPLIMIGVGVKGILSVSSHNTNYILKDPVFFGKTEVKMYNILNRSSYDPVFAPRGKSTLQIQLESPWEIWENLSGDEYYAEKEKIREKTIEILENHFPGITPKIETVDIATPRTTVNYTGVWKGAYEGFMPSRDVINGLPMHLPGLENLTLTGQWLYPGGGIPPAAQSGKWAIKLLTKKDRKEFKT